MKKFTFWALFTSCLILQVAIADDEMVSAGSMSVDSSANVHDRLAELQKQKKNAAENKKKRELEALVADIALDQEMLNLQNQFVSQLRMLSQEFKQTAGSAQAVREFKSKNASLIEDAFGKKEALLFKKIFDLLPEQPSDVQNALISASVKSLSYPTHGLTKEMRGKQKQAKNAAQDFPEMESMVMFS